MDKSNKVLVKSRNMEILRDFAEHFPCDLLGNYTGWSWVIDDMERLHLIQDPTTWQGCREDEILGYLDVQFEGDGVMVIYLCTFTDNIKIARGLYDDHCLDSGAKFKRLMETMDPRSRKFSTTLKDALKAYNDAYWKNEGYDKDLVIGPDYKTIEMW